jgi:peptidoglycan biosynthesis protein MviN/MurJ (putative lipid II flippase)
LLSSTAVVGAATVLARIAGAAKTALITFFFGPGTALDAYLLAFLIISSVVDVLFGSIASALVPALVEAEETGRDSVALVGNALRFTLSAATFLLLTGVMGWQIARALGFAARFDRSALVPQMLAVMIPMLPLTALTSVWRSVLNSRLMFIASSLSFGLTPIVAVALLLAAHSYGVISLALGSMCGVLAEALFLAIILGRAGLPVLPLMRRPVDAVRWPARQYSAILTSSLLIRGAAIIAQSFAAAAGVGGISIFNLSTRLSTVLIAVGPGSLSTAILPRFSRSIARGETAEARRSFIRALGGAVACMAAISAALIWLTPLVVRVAFSHGALTPADLAAVAAAQRWSLAQAPFTVGLAVVLPLIASLRANQATVPLWTAALCAHAVCDYFVVRRYGVTGIACVTALIEAVVLFGAISIVFRRLAGDGLMERGPRTQ